MCPWCRPSVDAGFASRGVLSSTIQLHRFEQRDAQAAKVRNVSKVGTNLFRHLRALRFPKTPLNRSSVGTFVGMLFHNRGNPLPLARSSIADLMLRGRGKSDTRDKPVDYRHRGHLRYIASMGLRSNAVWSLARCDRGRAA